MRSPEISDSQPQGEQRHKTRGRRNVRITIIVNYRAERGFGL